MCTITEAKNVSKIYLAHDIKALGKASSLAVQSLLFWFKPSKKQ
jgi:hypothetical protein